jgi:hypothetical protein
MFEGRYTFTLYTSAKKMEAVHFYKTQGPFSPKQREGSYYRAHDLGDLKPDVDINNPLKMKLLGEFFVK